jgi:acyl-CoA thioesterase I
MNQCARKIFFQTGMFLVFVPFLIFSQQDTIRVACVGNSITEGNAMSSKLLDAYPIALGRYLGAGYKVINCGVSGRTLTKKGDFPIWKETAFSQALSFNPNIVTILLGTNDSKPYNWIHKDEFMSDYYAMIDTFRQRPSHPEIYICLPLPSFSDAYDIRDSIINADIIPMIRRIADSAKVKLIDFNTPFLDKKDLMPDGIHPLIAGSDLMARIFYRELTGTAIDTSKENNVALHKRVYLGTSLVPELTDGNAATKIGVTSTSSPLIMNLGNDAAVDMIQINFTDSLWSKVSFTLAISKDSLVWTTVADTSLIDTVLLSDKNILKYVATFKSDVARFIRFQMNQGGTQENSAVLINEMKVFESRVVHAPVLGWKFISQTSQTMRLRFIPQRTTNKNEMMKMYRQNSTKGTFALNYNYGNPIPSDLQLSITFGVLNKFYCTVYYNGAEITSDTLTVTGEKMTGVSDDEKIYPATWTLSQNYPNPFNPSTTLEYSVEKECFVSLKIYDLLGREIKTLVQEVIPAGIHSVRYDATGLNSGMYLYRINAGRFHQTRKMVLLR